MATKKSGPRPMSATAAQPALEGTPEPEPTESMPSGRSGPTGAVTSTTKYTVLLDMRTDHQFEGLTDHAADMLGRIAVAGTRKGRYPSRSDVLRALVHIAHDDIELKRRMLDQIETDLASQ